MGMYLNGGSWDSELPGSRRVVREVEPLPQFNASYFQMFSWAVTISCILMLLVGIILPFFDAGTHRYQVDQLTVVEWGNYFHEKDYSCCQNGWEEVRINNGLIDGLAQAFKPHMYRIPVGDTRAFAVLPPDVQNAFQEGRAKLAPTR